jgi:diguanylate cyclase (GGDEF)-like protein
MAEEERFDDELRALDRAAEERGARALPEIEAAITRLRAAGDPQRLAWALPPYARALALNEKLDEAQEASAQALAYFSGSGSARGQAFALNAQGMIAQRRGEPARAIEIAGNGLALARNAKDPVLQVRLSNVAGTVLADMGRLAESVQVLEDGLAAASGFPDEPVALRVRLNLAGALGRWALREHDERLPETNWRPRAERAIELLTEALPSVRERATPEQVASVLDNVATAYIVLGRLPEAHAALDEAEALSDPAAAPHSTVFLSCARARVHLQAGEPARALEAIARGHAAADHRGGHVYVDELYRLKSLAHEARGELAQALETHKLFHEHRTRIVLERAEQQASALSVALEAERALRQVNEERIRAERAILEARNDPLTGLPNRRRFDEYLAGMLPRTSIEHPICLVLIDLDHFKSINDRHGHQVGDAALRWLATNLMSQCRQTDLGARLGGDEFALVIGAPLAVALRVCERLRVGAAHSCPDLPPDITVRLSMGVAEATGPCDAGHLISRADKALYAAKAAGRDTVRSDPPSPPLA